MRWRTGNNRRRAKELKQGGLYTLRRGAGGPTWAEQGDAADIVGDVARMIREVTGARVW